MIPVERLVLSTVLFAWFIHHSAVEGVSRVSGAAIEYEFAHEDCVSGRYVDAASSDLLGGMLRQMTTTECARGIGVVSSSAYDDEWRVRSVSTVESLYAAISENEGFTIELWIQPDADTMSSTTDRPLFSIGANGTSCGSDDMSRVLSQSEQKLYWKQTGTDSSTFNVGDTVLSSTASSTQTHLVIVDEEDCGFSLYANGVYALGVSGWCYDLDPSYVAQLFTNCYTAGLSSYSVWSGTVYLLAVYPRALNSSEIEQNYAAKLTNSAPVVSDVTVTVQEDGERGSHYDNPAWYRSEEDAGALAMVSLGAVDVDDDPNYVNYSPDNDIMKVYVASLPPKHLAVLYTLGGVEITSLPAAVSMADDGNYSVRIRPAWNAFSPDSDTPFVNFTYYAVDGVTGVQSSGTAVASVIVTSKNDPAVAYASLNATVYAGRKTILPSLLGDAVESSDSIVRAFISRLPSRGNLYFANESEMGSKPISILPTALTVGSVVELPHGSLWVAYEYTGTAEDSESGFLFAESFGFRLLDEAGENDFAVGVEGNYTVFVKTALEACFSAGCPEGQKSSDAVQSLYEDSVGSTVTLYGYDYSDNRDDIKFVITSLPSHGTISDPTTSSELAVGDELSSWSSYPYSSGVALTYVPDEDYFNFPSTRYNGSSLGLSNDLIYFKALPANPTESSSASSLEAAIEVVVKNVNDPARLINTTESALEIYAVSYTMDDSDDDVSYPTTLFVPGLELRDADHDVDVVTVYITAEKGTISLNDADLEQLDYSGGLFGVCFRYSEWQCKGDGNGDSTMRFVGQPSDINRALRNLQYKCTEDDVTDTVSISVYDGDGIARGCIDGDDLDDGNCCSDRTSGCHVSSIQFSVEVKEYAIVAAYYAETNCDDDRANCLDRTETLLVICGILLSCLCCCGACVRHFCCRAKKPQSGQESTEEGEFNFDQNQIKARRKCCLVRLICCCGGKAANKDESEKEENKEEEKRKKKCCYFGCCCCLCKCVCAFLRFVRWVLCFGQSKRSCGGDVDDPMNDAPNPVATDSGCSDGPHKTQVCKRSGSPVARQSVVDVLARAQLSQHVPALLELGIFESEDLALCKDEELIAAGLTTVEIRRLRRKLPEITGEDGDEESPPAEAPPLPQLVAASEEEEATAGTRASNSSATVTDHSV